RRFAEHIDDGVVDRIIEHAAEGREVGRAEPTRGRADVLVEDGALAHVLHLGGHAGEAVVLVDDPELAPITDLWRDRAAERAELAVCRQPGHGWEPALARTQLSVPPRADLAGPVTGNRERARGRRGERRR